MQQDVIKAGAVTDKPVDVREGMMDVQEEFLREQKEIAEQLAKPDVQPVSGKAKLEVTFMSQEATAETQPQMPVDEEVEKAAQEEREREARRIARQKSREQQRLAEEAALEAALESAEQEVSAEESGDAVGPMETAKSFADRATVADWLKRRGFSTVLSRRRSLVFGSTFPLHAAVKENDAEMIRLLVQAGADPALKNSSGQTPLRLAQKCDKKGSHFAALQVLGGGSRACGGA